MLFGNLRGVFAGFVHVFVMAFCTFLVNHDDEAHALPPARASPCCSCALGSWCEIKDKKNTNSEEKDERRKNKIGKEKMK